MSEPKCPICARAQDAKFRPFCSKRCADVDLGRWFSGRYAIAAEEEDDVDPAERRSGDED